MANNSQVYYQILTSTVTFTFKLMQIKIFLA